MRKILTLTALMVLVLASCRREYHSDRAQWPRMTPEIDSLTYLLEREMTINRNMDSITMWVEALERADNNGARSSLFRARLWRSHSNGDSSLAALKRAKSMVDSNKDPYTWTRIRMDEARHSGSAFETFKTISQGIQFYRSVKDSFMLGNSLVEMSNLLCSCNLPWQSLKYLEEGQKVFQAINMPEICSRININKANLLSEMGHQHECDSINKLLLNDPTLENEIGVRELILRNLYVSTGDIDYILEDYDLIGEKMKTITPIVLTLVSEAYYNLKQTDSAYKYAKMANDRESNIKNKRQLILKDRAYANALEQKGMKDSACFYYHRLLDLQDSLEKISTVQDVLQLETNYSIALYEHQESERRYSERLRWIGIVAIIIMVCAFGAFLLYRKNQLEKINKLKVEMELDRNRRQMAATLLAMEEKDRLLTKMGENLSSGRATSQELETMLKVHTAGNEESKAFSEIFEKISPTFVKNLRTKYPNLQDYYIKLASYIYAGMSNHQIARLLAVRLESVHQSRTRLRKMLGLTSTSTTLEEALRALGEEE